MFPFFCGISGAVSEYINCRLVIVLDNERLVSEEIFEVSLEIRPPHSIWERSAPLPSILILREFRLLLLVTY